MASETYGGDVEGAIRTAIDQMRSDIEEVRRDFGRAHSTPAASSATEFQPASPAVSAAPSETAPASSDALEQADAIVRSASGTTIDWTREPLTERERKIRRAMLNKIVEHDVVPSLSIDLLIPYQDRDRGAQDWRAALADAKALEERERLERDRERLQDAIAAVDGADEPRQ